MFQESQSCVRRFIPHTVCQSCSPTYTDIYQTYVQSYMYKILMGFTLYETTERALTDSLGVFSIKKIPFGIKESLRGGNRHKEGKKKREKDGQEKSAKRFTLLIYSYSLPIYSLVEILYSEIHTHIYNRKQYEININESFVYSTECIACTCSNTCLIFILRMILWHLTYITICFISRYSAMLVLFHSAKLFIIVDWRRLRLSVNASIVVISGLISGRTDWTRHLCDFCFRNGIGAELICMAGRNYVANFV